MCLKQKKVVMNVQAFTEKYPSSSFNKTFKTFVIFEHFFRQIFGSSSFFLS
eukprot:UN05646